MSRFWTAEEIELEVDKLSGGWVKRRNLRARLTLENNKHVDREISDISAVIRNLRAIGTTEQNIRHWYAEKSKLEFKKL